MPPPPPDTARTILGIFILLLYFYTSSDPANNPGFGVPSPHERLQQAIARQHHAFEVLQSTRWGAFNAGDAHGAGAKWGVNLTGFRERDGYAWEHFGAVRDRAKLLVSETGLIHGGAFYENVTGVVLGQWIRNKAGSGNDSGWDTSRTALNITEIAPNAFWAQKLWDRNITGTEGNIILRIDEDDKVDGQMMYNATGFDGEGGGLDSNVHIRDVSSTMTIEDESHGGNGWEIRLHGVHWPKQGAMVLTTTSEKFSGIYGLPHLTTDEKSFLSSQKLLNRTLGVAIKKRERQVWGDTGDPWSGDEVLAAPHCEFVVYVQVHPIRPGQIHGKSQPLTEENLSSDLHELERELRFPLGAPTVSPPPLTMSIVIFSPDCGFVLESKGPPSYTPTQGTHLTGLKQEVYTLHVKNWSLIWGLALLCQMLLLRVQMKETSTPSTISRISLYTVGMMAAADAILFGSLLLLAASVPAVFPAATLAAFAVSMCTGLEARFVTNIYKIQEPERIEAERERAARAAEVVAQMANYRERRAAAASASIPANTSTGADNGLLSGTHVRSTTSSSPPNDDRPIIIPSDQDVDAEIEEVLGEPLTVPVNDPTRLTPASRTQDLATTYGQFLMLFICFFFLTVNSASWPSILRKIYINTVGLLYLSLWSPQIYRNIIRNCRKAFLWKFVVGQSVLRILPFTYFYLKDDNVLFAANSGFSVLLLGGWLWIQIWLLVAQEVLGPRFCIPKGWLPEAWDYYPILREDDVEGGGLPIGLARAPGSPSLERVRTEEQGHKKSDGHTRSVDCAICMQRLDVQVVPSGHDGSSSITSGTGGVTGMLTRRYYMVTPCRHIFHSICLEGWMKFRLQCPICRENLPPL